MSDIASNGVVIGNIDSNSDDRRSAKLNANGKYGRCDSRLGLVVEEKE